MENKYYTPNISEFHVGFEYEVLFRNTIIKTTYQISSDLIAVNRILEKEDKDFEIRVKYLDKEDIESLGFKEDPSSRPNRLVYEKNIDDYVIGIVRYTTTSVLLYKYKYSEERLFNGTVNNKFELIKLLKQINLF